MKCGSGRPTWSFRTWTRVTWRPHAENDVHHGSSLVVLRVDVVASYPFDRKAAALCGQADRVPAARVEVRARAPCCGPTRVRRIWCCKCRRSSAPASRGGFVRRRSRPGASCGSAPRGRSRSSPRRRRSLDVWPWPVLVVLSSAKKVGEAVGRRALVRRHAGPRPGPRPASGRRGFEPGCPERLVGRVETGRHDDHVDGLLGAVCGDHARRPRCG